MTASLRAARLAAIAALVGCGPNTGSVADVQQAPLHEEPPPIAFDAAPLDSPPAVRCETRTLQVGVVPIGYRATGQICDGLRQGAWSFVFLDGTPHREGSYEDGLETGRWTFWYQAGLKRSEGEFAKGQRSGHWTRYHENGTRSLEGDYERGLRDGRWRRWHDNGQIYEDRIYRAGKREGRHHKWNAQGLLQYTRLCREDLCEIKCTVGGTRSCPPLEEPMLTPEQ